MPQYTCCTLRYKNFQLCLQGQRNTCTVLGALVRLGCSDIPANKKIVITDVNGAVINRHDLLHFFAGEQLWLRKSRSKKVQTWYRAPFVEKDCIFVNLFITPVFGGGPVIKDLYRRGECLRVVCRVGDSLSKALERDGRFNLSKGFSITGNIESSASACRFSPGYIVTKKMDHCRLRISRFHKLK